MTVPRKQSDATKLREMQDDYARLHKDYISLENERKVLAGRSMLYQEGRSAALIRAERAENEVEEWKNRFDILLRREKNEPTT